MSGFQKRWQPRSMASLKLVRIWPYKLIAAFQILSKYSAKSTSEISLSQLVAFHLTLSAAWNLSLERFQVVEKFEVNDFHFAKRQEEVKSGGERGDIIRWHRRVIQYFGKRTHEDWPGNIFKLYRCSVCNYIIHRYELWVILSKQNQSWIVGNCF